MMKKFLRVLIVLIVIAGVVGGVIYYKRGQAEKLPARPGGGPPVVIIQTPEIQDVEDYELFTGNTTAVETVDLRARVAGFLQRVHFADGAHVKAGDLLFSIEPDTFEAACQQGRAQVEASQAELERARLDYERIEKAVKTNAVSKQDLSTAQAAWDKAKASVTSAQAGLKTAELNLSYTRIYSPIDGIINFHQVSAGNLVGAGQQQTLLATVVTIQPIYVTFNVSENILQTFFIEHQPRRAASEPPHAADDPPGEASRGKPVFYVGLSEDEGYPYQGYLDYLDTRVDPDTGNILVRGVLANEAGKLLPGLFVRVRVPTGVRKNAVLIEERAVQSDIGGRYVLVLDEKNIIHIQYVQLGKTVGEMRVIDAGLKGEERYVVSGFTFARPGSPVTAQREGEAPSPGSAPGQDTGKMMDQRPQSENPTEGRRAPQGESESSAEGQREK